MMQDLAKEIILQLQTSQEVCVLEGIPPCSPFEDGDEIEGSVNMSVRRMRRPRHDRNMFILEQTVCHRPYHGPMWDENETFDEWKVIATFDDASMCLRCFRKGLEKFGYRIHVEGHDLCVTDSDETVITMLKHIL